MKRVVFTLALLAALPAQAQQVDATRVVRPYWWDQPVVEALGRAEVEVEPNRASFNVAFIRSDGDAARSTDEPIARARLAYDAIKKVTGDKARVETGIQVDPYYEQYRDKDGELVDNERADKVKGYQAKVTVRVYLNDISLAGRARAAAMALGPQSAEDIVFDLQETPDMQRGAIKAAAEDARARAELTATASGVKLGDLLVLQEGQGPCLGSWSTSQVARQVGASPPANATRPGTQQPTEFAKSLSEDRQRVIVTAQKREGGRIDVTEADVTRFTVPSDWEPQTIEASVCAVYVLKK